jgi:glycosyltransferase involved in cell wall biosynthesis
MSSPLISIILPTLGERESFAAALRSALAQGDGEIEVIVVDDSLPGSAWTNREPLASLLKEPRVRLLPWHKQTGCAAAKNAGLAAAKGEWVCYLDDDNEYLPGKVSGQLALARGSQSELVLCGLELRSAGRRRLRQTGKTEFRGDALLLEAWPDTNVLFHSADCGLRWDEELGTADDACFFHSFIKIHGLVSVPNLPSPLVLYRVHEGVRANTDFLRLYRGQRRLLVRHALGYGRRARRLAMARLQVALCKYRQGGWGRLAGWSLRLLREGGAGELRHIANAVGVKLPFLRPWMMR